MTYLKNRTKKMKMKQNKMEHNNKIKMSTKFQILTQMRHQKNQKIKKKIKKRLKNNKNLIN